MNITGGNANKRKISAPRTLDVRPMLARVRRSLFDTIGDDIIDAVVLDLYSGVGSIGLEALSRGAAFITFVEVSAKHANFLQKNLNTIGFSDKATVIQAKVNYAIRHLQKPERLDFVFIDPPFEKKGDWDEFAFLPELITTKTIAVLHVAKRDTIIVPKYWTTFRTNQVGDSALIFMQKS